MERVGPDDAGTAAGKKDRDDRDDGREDRLALLRTIDWGKITKRLTVKARKWGADPALAKDLAQDAIVHVLKNGGASWEPTEDPTAFRFLLYVMDWKYDAWLTRRTSREAKLPTDLDSDAVDQTPPESDRDVERAFLHAEAIERNLARLREGLAEFPLTLALLELARREGQQNPRTVAEKLGVDVKAVYTAEAQLQRHARRLRADGSDPDLKVSAVAGGGA